jgi:hypothetical protein
MIDCIMSLVICGIGNVNKGSRMKEIVKPITLVLFLLVLFNQQAAAQDWEKATKSQIELANNLHQWLKIGNQKAILDAFLQSTELAKLVKEQEGNINPNLFRYLINSTGTALIKKGDKILTDIIGGGAKSIDWNRVYLKDVWRTSVAKAAPFDLDMIMIQFSHGAAKVWLLVQVVQIDGELYLCLIKKWGITRDGVLNLPIPDSTKDRSKYGELRRSMELVIDLARFPKPISKADDQVPTRAKEDVTAFERATSFEELGRHVFNCCVAGDFDAAGKALVPGSLNKDTEGLSAGQFEVLAALDLEKIYANTMVDWGFHWQDCVIKSVTQKNCRIIVTFKTLMQLKDGTIRDAELAFAIYGSKQIAGVWYLATNPEYPTGISSVTMQGVTIDVSGLRVVSGRLTLDGNPLANAVITMTPWVTVLRNSKAERGLNSRIPSGRTNSKGEFTMTVTYNSDSGQAVVFNKIATNKYMVGVVDGVPMDSKDSTLERKAPNPVDPKSAGEIKVGAAKRVPQVFANPFGLKQDGKFLVVDKPLTTVLIKLTSDGKMEVVAASP